MIDRSPTAFLDQAEYVRHQIRTHFGHGHVGPQADVIRLAGYYVNPPGHLPMLWEPVGEPAHRLPVWAPLTHPVMMFSRILDRRFNVAWTPGQTGRPHDILHTRPTAAVGTPSARAQLVHRARLSVSPRTPLHQRQARYYRTDDPEEMPHSPDSISDEIARVDALVSDDTPSGPVELRRAPPLVATTIAPHRPIQRSAAEMLAIRAATEVESLTQRLDVLRSRMRALDDELLEIDGAKHAPPQILHTPTPAGSLDRSVLRTASSTARSPHSAQHDAFADIAMRAHLPDAAATSKPNRRQRIFPRACLHSLLRQPPAERPSPLCSSGLPRLERVHMRLLTSSNWHANTNAMLIQRRRSVIPQTDTLVSATRHSHAKAFVEPAFPRNVLGESVFASPISKNDWHSV